MFVTRQFRIAICGTALVAGLWYLTGATAAPTLPKDTYKKQIDADVAAVKAQLKWIAENPKDANAKSAARTVKTAAMLLVLNAEATGDAALRDQALKLAEVSNKLADTVKARPAMRVEKDVLDAVMAASVEADKLTHKPGASPLKAGDGYKDAKYNFDLEHAMTPFRPGDRGGMNIEKDIRDMVKKDNALKVDPAAVELLAARTALIGEFAIAYPNDKAKMNPANQKEWNKITTEMIEISQKIAAEAGKGKGANEKELVKMLDVLNNKCYKCHSDFRDE